MDDLERLLLAERVASNELDSAAYRLACDVADNGKVWTAGGEWPTRDELAEQFKSARSAWLAARDAARDAAEAAEEGEQ